jgi:WD40 repeat protein
VAALVGALMLAILTGTAVSTYFAVKAEARARDATERLWESYLAQAQARRFSGRPGRRVASLEALASAAAIRPTLELRNEAIASMALVDLRVAKEWEGRPPRSYGLAFDAKLERYSIGDAKGNLTIRTVADNREVMRLPGPGHPAWVVRFSPSGRWLAAKYHPPGENNVNRVWVWDLTRGQTVLKTEHPVLGAATAFSPDERWLAAGWYEGGISLFDLDSGREARRLPSEAPVGFIMFHPDGTRYATWTPDSRAFVCGTEDGRTLRVLSGGPQWHPGGKLLAVACPDSRIRVYDAGSLQERTILEASAYQLVFSHGHDLLASVGEDRILRLWHPLDSSPLLSVPGVVVAGALEFGPDDRLLSHRVEGSKISLFEVVPAPECRKLIAQPPSEERIWDADVSPDGRLLAGAYTDGVRLWDLGQSDQVACLPGRDWRAAKFTRDGTALIVSGGPGLWRWPIARGGQTSAGTLRIGPGERILLPAETALVGGCSLDHEGRTLAVVAADAVLVFDRKTQKEKTRFGGHRGALGAVLGPDARWLACTTWHGSGVKVFDTQNGKLALSVPDTENSLAAFSPDGKWLVIGTGPEYRLWSVGSWAPGLRFARQGTEDVTGPIAFAPDGRIMAIVPSWRLVRLVDVERGVELATLEGPDVEEMIAVLSFSPDGACLIAASLSRRLYVWDLRLIRQGLAAMGLDWDLPPYAPVAPPAAPPLRVEVVPK